MLHHLRRVSLPACVFLPCVCTIARALAVLVAATCAFGAQAPQPARVLQITAPVKGATVNPGQRVTVIVTASPGTSIRGVMVVGEDPLGATGATTSLPAQFSITVPSSIAPGTYTLTAVGATTNGQAVESEPVVVDVEYATAPRGFFPPPKDIPFEAPGERIPIRLQALFTDRAVDVNRSTLVTYRSSNTRVATVDAHGTVTAVAPGTATISIVYRLPPRTVQTALTVTVPTPILTPSKFALEFGERAVGSIGEGQRLTLTNTAYGPIRIVAIETTPEFAQTNDCPAAVPLASKASCTVTVVFSPGVAGPRTGVLSVSSSASAVPTAIRLSGIGTAAAPRIALSDRSAIGFSVTVK